VQIGPFEAISIERTGNTPKIEILISEDAPLGVLMDCRLEFKTPNGPRAVFKRNNTFRFVEDEAP